jgi:hypothetical protein
MAKYLARACPRCNGYVDVTLHGAERDTPLKAVNGRCLKCSYRLAWIVIKGGRKALKLRGHGKLYPARSRTVTLRRSLLSLASSGFALPLRSFMRTAVTRLPLLSGAQRARDG